MIQAEHLRAHFTEHSRVVEDTAAGLIDQIEQYASWVADTIASGGRLFLCGNGGGAAGAQHLSLIHISEPTRRRGISYAVFCLKKKT